MSRYMVGHKRKPIFANNVGLRLLQLYPFSADFGAQRITPLDRLIQFFARNLSSTHLVSPKSARRASTFQRLPPMRSPAGLLSSMSGWKHLAS
jgi:hypothetical protein